MEPWTDLGSPQLRTTAERPLTVTEWNSLQPFITYAYKKKQYTARTILQELNKRGFYVTDRILRTRLKQWRIDDKNKRKDKDPNASHQKQCARASISCGNFKDYHSTPINQIVSITDYHPHINDDVRHCFDDAYAQPDDQSSSVPGRPTGTGAIHQSLNSAQQLHWQRVIGAVANWYDHLSSMEHVTQGEPSQRFVTAQLFDKLVHGLNLATRDVYAGRKLLQDAGTGISAVLRSPDPTLVARLLFNFTWWQSLSVGSTTFREHAAIVTTFLTRTSYHYLGAVHPITLLVQVLVRECLPPELCDMLCKAIELNYIRKLRGHSLAKNALLFRRIFGDFLIAQRRYLDVEVWYERYNADRKSLTPNARDDVWAQNMLISAKIYRGAYDEAGRVVAQAMIYLKDHGLQYSRDACCILDRSAWLTRNINDCISCEHLLQERLRIAQHIDDELETMLAVSKLWEFYKACGRPDMAAQLEESYPDILGE